MNNFDELLNKTKRFLERLANGEFQDNEEQAIEQFNILCQEEVVEGFLLSEYFPALLRNKRAGIGHIQYLANSTLKYSAPSLARTLAESLINRYSVESNEELLDLLIELILEYRLFDFLSIENEGRNIRFESKRESFTLKTEAVRSELRLNLLRISLEKYSRILTDNGPPSAQEIQPIILRFNTLVNLINGFDQGEIIRYPTLLSIGLADSNISYSTSNSFKLFNNSLTALQYDERLFEHFRLPLLPVINKDKINFDGQKLQFQNEGLGSLPPFSVTIAVGPMCHNKMRQLHPWK